MRVSATTNHQPPTTNKQHSRQAACKGATTEQRRRKGHVLEVQLGGEQVVDEPLIHHGRVERTLHPAIHILHSEQGNKDRWTRTGVQCSSEGEGNHCIRMPLLVCVDLALTGGANQHTRTQHSVPGSAGCYTGPQSCLLGQAGPNPNHFDHSQPHGLAHAGPKHLGYDKGRGRGGGADENKSNAPKPTHPNVPKQEVKPVEERGQPNCINQRRARKTTHQAQ